MFAREVSVQPGRQTQMGGAGPPLSPFSPHSPNNYSPHDLTTPTSPLKLEVGGYYPPSPAFKSEPLSPSNPFSSRGGGGRGPVSSSPSGGGGRGGPHPLPPHAEAPSPYASSLDSLPPYSPMGGGGGGGILPFTSASSPLSPSSTATLSPSAKIGREDLSPASSINSYGGTETSSIDRKKKGGALGRQTEELCLVCGDRASGYHYNALTCEGCKGFFRRSITKDAVYTCKYGKNCEMDMYMRRKCQECRFKKCISVGMRPECVVPEITCRIKRKQKKDRDKDKPGYISQDISKQQLHSAPSSAPSAGLPSPLILPSSLQPSSCGKIELTKEHNDLINRLINNQEEFESPSPSCLKDIFGNYTQAQHTTYYQITEMTRLTVELIVQFALSLPGFATLVVDDQVTLLKACSSELIALRASRRYHADTDSIVFADNSPCTRDFYISAGIDAANTDSLFGFCKRMATMKVDNAEYALLAGITLFSERPNLQNPARVESIQYLYVETLYAYVTNKWAPKSGMMIAKLLDVLTQLRTLGNMNSEQCESFRSTAKQLPDLLLEMWDINKRTM